MMWKLLLAMALAWGAFAPAPAQSVIKVLQFEKNTGIIDKGEEAGLRVGDIFEVNRYAGDFVYWVGRVEVMVTKSKIAGVKALALAENAMIQPGDVLELRKRENDPALNKPRQAVAKDEPAASNPPGKLAAAALGAANKTWRRDNPITLGFSSGVLQPLAGPSHSFGLNLTLQIRNSSNNQLVREIDMSRAYATGFALQTFGSVPFSKRLALSIDYAFAWLNIENSLEASLLEVGAKASGSLMKIGTALRWRAGRRFQGEAGVGLFLPQVTIRSGNQAITVSERDWGVTMNTSYLIPLGAAVWLKPALGYNFFWDDGPDIHYLTFQIGPSFTIGKP